MNTITQVHGVCPHDCPDSCGVITDVVEGTAVGFRGDPDHPITQGWLCGKVRPYLERVYHPERLRHPLKRVGAKGEGAWVRISWEEALATIAERWQAIIATDGPTAILPYHYSGTLGLVQMGVSGSRFWNRLGASRLDQTICGAAAEYTVKATLGSRHCQPYEDAVHSRLVIIWGHNPIATAPHFMPHLRRAQRAGCQLVVIDPRRTRTARGADWHLAPIPGSDAALALGIAHLLVTKNQHDETWLQAHTVGWPALRQRLDDYQPARVAALTGLAEDDIRRLADLYARTRPGLIKFADGLQRHQGGGQAVRALLTLPALTGQYGLPGGGVAYTTSGYLQWDDEAVNKWSHCPPPARKINMNRLGAALLGEVTDPPLRALFVFGANPAVSNPNAGKVVAGLRRPDLFTVVHELFMTDTARYADIVLPATSQLEQMDIHKGYGHTVLAYNAPAVPPLGESKSNWEVMGRLAEAMGFDEPWLHQSAAEVADEVLAATARHTPELAGITVDRLAGEKRITLPFAPQTPFADGHFPTPSGKVELYSQRLADDGYDPLPAYVAPTEIFEETGAANGRPVHFRPEESLTLVTAASHHFVNSSLANVASLRERAGEPVVEIHPHDASLRGIVEGQGVIIENERGWCRLAAHVTEAVRPGVVASPKGQWPQYNDGRNVNWTTSDALADMAGQSTFQSNRVWVRG